MLRWVPKKEPQELSQWTIPQTAAVSSSEKGEGSFGQDQSDLCLGKMLRAKNSKGAPRNGVVDSIQGNPPEMPKTCSLVKIK